MFLKTIPRVKDKLNKLRGRQEARSELMRRLERFPGHLVNDYIADAGKISELEEWLTEQEVKEKQ